MILNISKRKRAFPTVDLPNNIAEIPLTTRLQNLTILSIKANQRYVERHEYRFHQMVRYYGYYSNVLRGQLIKKRQDELIPFFLSEFPYLVVPLRLQGIQYSAMNRKSPKSLLAYDYYT